MLGDLGILTVRVDNWPLMLAYYRDTLALKPRFVDEKNQYAMFDTGAVRIALEGPLKPAFAKRPGKNALVANLKTADLANTLVELKSRGVKVLTAIHQGPNYTYAVIEDPEGNETLLYQPQPPAPRPAP